jgi:GTA TIM-barrel-like domain
MRAAGLAVILLAVAGAAAAANPAPALARADSRQGVSAASDARQRGVAWVGGRETVTAADLEPLRVAHVNWIAQTPFGWQRGLASTEIRMATSGRVWWGESDAGIATTTRLARAAGIRTLLKPHLWLSGAAAGEWIGDIAMTSEAEWARWFASYRAFLLHYAKLAEREGIAALAIGTELRIAAVTREADWRRLIAEVRTVYHGQLTYAANWHQEYAAIQFWDALDFVGIQGYFPLAERPGASVAELERGWQRHLPAIEALSKRLDKSVVFTEIGYKSTPDTAVEPWVWPQGGPGHRYVDPTRADAGAQADAYEAFFRAVWQRPWCAGAFFWKWYPRPRAAAPAAEPADIDFTPQGKPAALVLARWYAAAAGVPAAPTQSAH